MGRHLVTDTSILRLEDIYRAHLRRVRWILRARGIGDDVLDDLVHEVFLAIHRRLPERDEQVPLATWIAGVARNVAFSHRRSEARERRGLETISAPHPPEAPDVLFDKHRAWRELEDFLDEIEPPQREVFVMAELLGMRVPEVAEVVDAPLNTLYSRLRLARRRFDERFGERAQTRWVQRAGEGEAPSADARRQGWALIAVKLAPATATILPVATAGIAKWWLTAAVAVAVVGGTYATVGREPTLATGGAPGERSAQRERVAVPPPPEDAQPSPAHAPAPDLAPVPAIVTSPKLSVPHDAEEISAHSEGRPEIPKHEVPSSPSDDAEGPSLARAVDVLRTAQRRLAEGDPHEALGAIDGYRREFDRGPLFQDMLRLERDAACRAGRTERARQALAGLRALGVASSTTPCPVEKKPATP